MGTCVYGILQQKLGLNGELVKRRSLHAEFCPSSKQTANLCLHLHNSSQTVPLELEYFVNFIWPTCILVFGNYPECSVYYSVCFSVYCEFKLKSFPRLNFIVPEEETSETSRSSITFDLLTRFSFSQLRDSFQVRGSSVYL